jgi:hypothetical protein
MLIGRQALRADPRHHTLRVSLILIDRFINGKVCLLHLCQWLLLRPGVFQLLYPPIINCAPDGLVQHGGWRDFLFWLFEDRAVSELKD